MKYSLFLFALSLLSFCAQGQEDSVLQTEAHYEQLVEDRMLALDLHNLGYKHFRKHAYDSALIYFDRALALDTSNAHYFANRGHAYRAISEWELAMADYERSNAVDAEWTHETYFFAAEILQKHLNRPEEALPLYDKAAEVMMANYMPVEIYLCHFNKGNIYLKLKRYKEAIAAYSIALDQHKAHTSSLANRGVAYMALKQPDQACADWQQAADLGYTPVLQYLNAYCK